MEVTISGMMETQKRTSREQRGRERPRQREHLPLAWENGPCQVRIETDNPCPYPAVVKIRDVPFCKRCAREQEAYFAIGELTQPQVLDEGLLAKALEGIKRRSASGAGEARSATRARRAVSGAR
jgi:hypothetical protein